ncbi:MAG: hypothetical protein QM803_00945 [Rhodocyclaceae bacterium]
MKCEQWPISVCAGDSCAWGVVIRRKTQSGYVISDHAAFASQIREWRGAAEILVEPTITTLVSDDLIVVQLMLSPEQSAQLGPYSAAQWDLQMTLPDIGDAPHVVTTHSGRVSVKLDVTR